MSSFSSAQYAEAARAALDRLEPEMAADMARRAVGASAATRDAAAAAEGQELLAEALTALGEREGAAAAWRSSIAAAELVAPAAATVPQAERWLYLAQLLGGREALEAFEHGAEMLDACAGSSSAAPSSAAAAAAAAPAADAAASSSVDAQRIGARCALAELWMTDLCDEDEAEARCEAAVAAAVAVGPRDPEALQALANLRVTQGRHAEAGAAMATAVDTMHSADATDARQGLQATDAQFNFEARVSAARVLLECAGARAGESDVGGGGVEAARAVEVVDALLARDANVIELWYLSAVAHRLCDPPSLTTAAHYLRVAAKMLAKMEAAAAAPGGGGGGGTAELFEFDDQAAAVTAELELVVAAAKQRGTKLDEIDLSETPADEMLAPEGDEGEGDDATMGR